MKYEEVIKSESSRRNIYKCLSKCYQRPEESLHELTIELEQQASELNSRALSNARLLRNSYIVCKDKNDLHTDYARLFVGPYSLLAPPYGSIYLDGQRRTMGDSTIDAIHYYKGSGLEVASTFKEAPDHIATELEFMYFLIHEELRALACGDMKGFYDKLSLQEEFLTNHLNRWAESFAHTVKRNASTGFYVNLAKVLETFIAEDARSFAKIQAHPSINAEVEVAVSPL